MRERFCESESEIYAFIQLSAMQSNRLMAHVANVTNGTADANLIFVEFKFLFTLVSPISCHMRVRYRNFGLKNKGVASNPIEHVNDKFSQLRREFANRKRRK